MLKIKILIIIFCCIGVVKAQTVIPPSSETPPGWIYYDGDEFNGCLLYTSPSPRDGLLSRMPSSA